MVSATALISSAPTCPTVNLRTGVHHPKMEKSITYDGQWTSEEIDDQASEPPSWLAGDDPLPEKQPGPIRVLKVGRVSGPFRRRNGYHVDVRVQHAAGPTTHRMWVAHEVINEVGALRGTDEEDERLQIEKFAIAIINILQNKGVDLANPDWALEKEDVPFSSQFWSVRSLFNYYSDLPEELAFLLMGAIGPGNEPWDGVAKQAMGSHPLAIFTSNPNAAVSQGQ